MKITPESNEFVVHLRATTAISHHDPGQMDKSNFSLFRRQKHVFYSAEPRQSIPADPGIIAALLDKLPIPATLAPTFAQLTLPQFLASAILREFIALYGAGEGYGLFTGVERYSYLESRLKQAAVRSNSLLEMWSVLCDSLQVPNFDSNSEILADLLAISNPLNLLTLRIAALYPRLIVFLARAWKDAEKKQKQDAYTSSLLDADLVRLQFDRKITDLPVLVVELPTVSANSVRHQLVREPLMWHFLRHVGLDFRDLPPAAAALLYNGSDIKAKAKEPDNVYQLRRQVRGLYPNLSLIGGSADAFLLGESNLRVLAWVRCRENNAALAPYGLETNISAFDLVETYTLTRQENSRVARGQMVYSFETLATGTELVIVFALSPYTTDLERGALHAALREALQNNVPIGGQGARGFGAFALLNTISIREDLIADYERYLRDNAGVLRQGLLNGTLGTDHVVVS